MGDKATAKIRWAARQLRFFAEFTLERRAQKDIPPVGEIIYA
jgi:hypothetical protein